MRPLSEIAPHLRGNSPAYILLLNIVAAREEVAKHSEQSPARDVAAARLDGLALMEVVNGPVIASP